MTGRRGFIARRSLGVLVLGAAMAGQIPAQAADLFASGNWPAMASDRPAERVGDSLTVVINQSSVASNSAQIGSAKKTNASGQITATPDYVRSAQIGVSGDFSGRGQTGRADKMLAQIGVVVDEVLPNGDLHVSGQQSLNINGEHIKIKVSGRLRKTDISSFNTVQSSSLADANIEYDGAGFVSRSAKPGVGARILNWLGVL